MTRHLIGLRTAALAAVLGLLLLSAPPAAAVPFPIADPAALPAAAPPAPPADGMRQNGKCIVNGALPGFDPAMVPPSQAMMNLPDAWKASVNPAGGARGAGVTVVVIDSGVARQPRLPNLSGGGDYIEAGDGLVDCDGHGTAVAGIIGAAPGPDGFSGVAPDAKLISIRQSSGQFSPKTPPGGDPTVARTAGNVETLAQAIRTGADLAPHGVMNISAIDCFPAVKNVDQTALGAALHYAATEKDVVVVAAAGNTGGGGELGAQGNCESNPLMDPKRPEDPRNWSGATTISTPSYWQPYVLSVASLTPTGQPSAFSMAGPWVGIAAPGEQIVSLGNGPDSGLINGQPSNKEPLVPINGTSFAAPYVAGTAALVRSKFPDLNWHQVINRLVASAHNAARAPSNQVGAGVLDPVAALTWDIPDAEELPAHMPVIRVAPPTPAPRDDPWPRRIAVGVGALAVASVLIVMAVKGIRRDDST